MAHFFKLIDPRTIPNIYPSIEEGLKHVEMCGNCGVRPATLCTNLESFNDDMVLPHVCHACSQSMFPMYTMNEMAEKFNNGSNNQQSEKYVWASTTFAVTTTGSSLGKICFPHPPGFNIQFMASDIDPNNTTENVVGAKVALQWTGLWEGFFQHNNVTRLRRKYIPDGAWHRPETDWRTDFFYCPDCNANYPLTNITHHAYGPHEVEATSVLLDVEWGSFRTPNFKYTPLEITFMENMYRRISEKNAVEPLHDPTLWLSMFRRIVTKIIDNELSLTQLGLQLFQQKNCYFDKLTPESEIHCLLDDVISYIGSILYMYANIIYAKAPGMADIMANMVSHQAMTAI